MTFQLLTSDWNSLSDADKIKLFADITGEATISDLMSLGKFKVVCYSTNSGTANNLKITALPNDQIVLPNSLISLQSISEILSISITEDKTTSADSDIRYAFTTDLVTYMAFNPVTLQWNVVDTTNLIAEGMSAYTINKLSKANIADFFGSSKYIGVGFVMYSTSTSNTISIDNLAITANMAGSWDKAVFGTDYKYGYPANEELSVTLLSNGDYKINYSDA